eukprot:Hpha_TRINITY_DN8130_c0_g1::TRINITY_DN8130_c0_g1_i1::g.172094::m.172094
MPTINEEELQKVDQGWVDMKSNDQHIWHDKHFDDGGVWQLTTRRRAEALRLLHKEPYCVPLQLPLPARPVSCLPEDMAGPDPGLRIVSIGRVCREMIKAQRNQSLPEIPRKPLVKIGSTLSRAVAERAWRRLSIICFASVQRARAVSEAERCTAEERESKQEEEREEQGNVVDIPIEDIFSLNALRVYARQRQRCLQLEERVLKERIQRDAPPGGFGPTHLLRGALRRLREEVEHLNRFEALETPPRPDHPVWYDVFPNLTAVPSTRKRRRSPVPEAAAPPPPPPESGSKGPPDVEPPCGLLPSRESVSFVCAQPQRPCPPLQPTAKASRHLLTGGEEVDEAEVGGFVLRTPVRTTMADVDAARAILKTVLEGRTALQQLK